jgi:hypothetical protein
VTIGAGMNGVTFTVKSEETAETVLFEHGVEHDKNRDRKCQGEKLVDIVVVEPID